MMSLLSLKVHTCLLLVILVVGVVHLSFASVVALNSLDNNFTVVIYKSGSIVKQESNGRIVLTIKSIFLLLVNSLNMHLSILTKCIYPELARPTFFK